MELGEGRKQRYQVQLIASGPGGLLQVLPLLDDTKVRCAGAWSRVCEICRSPCESGLLSAHV